MNLDLKAIIPAVLLLVVHFFCFILWIAGWAASKQMDDNSGSTNPSRYYFTWGFLVSLSMMAATIGTCIPVSVVKKASLLALIFFVVVFAIPLSVVMGLSSNQLNTDDCGDLSDAAKDLCNGYKTLFVSTFFYSLLLAGKVVYVVVTWQREWTESSDFKQSFDRA